METMNPSYAEARWGSRSDGIRLLNPDSEEGAPEPTLAGDPRGRREVAGEQAGGEGEDGEGHWLLQSGTAKRLRN